MLKKKSDPRKLPLDSIWKYQLQMSKYVTEMKKKEPHRCVPAIKLQWVRKSKFDQDRFLSKCFFCTFALLDGTCADCPGALVDSEFLCSNDEYHYSTKPAEFYEKLLSLNKKRKESL
jgi:hypothetical protein